MATRLTRAAVIGGVGLALATAVPTAAQAAAVVNLYRGVPSCYAGPSDIPFLQQDIAITNSTEVFAADGSLNVTCVGQLPKGCQRPPEPMWAPVRV